MFDRDPHANSSTQKSYPTAFSWTVPASLSLEPAEQLPFDDGTLDAVVTTSAFHFFDQPAALREFHRILAPGGLAAVSAEMRKLFEKAGFTVSDQHRIRRPVWTWIVSDRITVGIKS
jgi:ubiquinone/menaquinone biosynthesis C-methylase UbiE